MEKKTFKYQLSTSLAGLLFSKTKFDKEAEKIFYMPIKEEETDINTNQHPPFSGMF